ncbi:MAG: hypothetical protein M1493_04920 [Firmicutes bacterium]|uniref:Uncharacterized protein n=1 Tax=Sulfobacillus benefaciens TaxID=453960 RepID=A0A2T2X9U6_9FIRM|nr:hypothetical protein [Bacillota bacterium]PSR31265.1 MAG: hypothetical protein C7B43_02535 [Sulfobacillus benefaciens]
MMLVTALLFLEAALLIGTLGILIWQAWRYVEQHHSRGCGRVVIFRIRGRKLVLRWPLTVWRVVGQKRASRRHRTPWIRILSRGRSPKTRSLRRRVR